MSLNVSISSVTLTTQVVRSLEQEVLIAGTTREVCGLFGGLFKEPNVALATAVHPLTNLSVLNESFAVDPEEFLQQRRSMERAGLEPVAMYHSHTGGSAEPSFRDLELPSITGLPSLIVALGADGMESTCYDDVDDEIITIPVTMSCGQGTASRGDTCTP